MPFIGMPAEFMHLILQTCSWLKSNKFNHLGDGNQYQPEMEVDRGANFTLYRCNVISDNDSKSV